MVRRFAGLLGMAAAGSLAVAVATPAGAVTTINTGAYDIYSTIALTSAPGIILAKIGGVKQVNGVAPPSYSHSASLASFSTSLGVGGLGFLDGSTGLVSVSASSPWNGTTGASGTATATLNGISGLGLFDLVGAGLDISATQISSTSSVGGDHSLLAVGSSTISGLSITDSDIAGFGTLTFSGTPTVDDVIYDAHGLIIELNRQIDSGANGTSSTADGIITQALYIGFSNYVLDGTKLTGEIVVGESNADIFGLPLSIPEPGAWALMLVGFAGMGATLRARRARKPATV